MTDQNRQGNQTNTGNTDQDRGRQNQDRENIGRPATEKTFGQEHDKDAKNTGGGTGTTGTNTGNDNTGTDRK